MVKSTAAALAIVLGLSAYALASPASGPETRAVGRGPALTVHVAKAPAGVRFTIRGSVASTLAPGRTAAIALQLSNPHRWPLRVRSLRVTLAGLNAPQARGEKTCRREDFSLRPFAGKYGFVIPARSSRTLAALRIPVPRWPQITMIDRSVNQDGCKAASLSLQFSGVAFRVRR